MSEAVQRADRLESTAEPIVRLRDVNVIYDMSHGESRVLDGVNLDVERNEIVGIVGESGSGKSMLASSLLDAVPKPGVTTGTITFHPSDDRDPIDVLDLSDHELNRVRWEDISMVFQGAMSSFNPTMTVRGHVIETIEAHEKDEDARIAHVRQLLRDLHLDPDRVLDSYPHELSGGMRQRALIALSLLLEPEVLVMDEPTAALDLLMQRSIISMLARLRDEYDLTILFITHDLPLVAGLTDRLAVLYAFKLIEIGQTRDVITDGAHPYTRALIGSVPTAESDVDKMEPIEGTSPDPSSIPSGCTYHPRCPLAQEECRQSEPPLDDIAADSDHVAACFFSDEARQTLDYAVGSADADEVEE